MNTTVTKKPKNTVVVEAELTVEEFQPYVDRAVTRLGKTLKVPGFRPGKIPLSVLREKLGEKTIMEEAAEEAVKKTYTDTVQNRGLTTVGPPRVQLLKLAAGNPLVYRATVALLPAVTLGETKSLKAVRRQVTVSEDDVTKAIDALRDARRTERPSLEPAKKSDKVEIDLEVFRDGVPLEGGQSKRHPVVIGESQFIPGFEDQLLGLRPNETKEFTLTFPNEYHQKHLRGKPAQFRIKIVDVFHLDRPAADDAFAQQVGDFTSIAALRAKIRDNLLAERTEREERRLESELLDQLIKTSRIEEVPDLLIEEEKTKMLDELEHDVVDRGMKFDDYLTSIRKTRESLKLEFAAPAERRIKSALVIRSLARVHAIQVPAEELERERAELKARYADDPAARSRLDDEEVSRYLATVLTNRRVLALLKETALGTSGS